MSVGINLVVVCVADVMAVLVSVITIAANKKMYEAKTKYYMNHDRRRPVN